LNTQQSNPHTVVVGAGVIGVATAYYLAQRGRRVTVLDQGDVCSGCSRGNAGQITPGHLPLTQPGTLMRNLAWVCKPTSPLFIAPRLDIGLLRWLWRFQRASNHTHLRQATEMLCRLGVASRELFDQLAGELEFGYQHQGRLEVCRTESSLAAVRHEAELLEDCGFEAKSILGRDVADFEPAITGDVAGAVYFPDSAACDPYQFVIELAKAAEAQGATFRPHTRVDGLHVGDGRVTAIVTLDDEFAADEIAADEVVLAGGSWTPELSRKLGLRLPIQPGKGYHLDISPPTPTPKLPVVLVEERVFATPIGDSLRLAGTMELSGLKIIEREAPLDILAVAPRR
jgi:D-amino-acid dehydrogenase